LATKTAQNPTSLGATITYDVQEAESESFRDGAIHAETPRTGMSALPDKCAKLRTTAPQAAKAGLPRQHASPPASGYT
jgi:hypothetical protein